VLNTHAEATFQIPDVTKVLAVPDLLKVYMQPAVIAIAEKVESDLLSLYASLRPTRRWARGYAHHRADHRCGGNRAVPGQDSAIRTEVHGSDAAHTPPGGRSAIQRIPDCRRRRFDGADRRTVGKIKDFFVFRSQLVPKTGTSPNINTHNLAFTRDALGLVIRRLPQPLPGTGAIAEYAELGNFGMRVVMSYQPNTLAQQFTVDILYGCGVLRKRSRRAGEHVAVFGAGRPMANPAPRKRRQKENSMDLRQYYQKISEKEAAFKEPYPVVVSLETGDGGKTGVLTK